MKKELYFISRNTWFYTNFSGFTACFRWAITISVLLILFILWFFTGYRFFSNMQVAYLVNIQNVRDQENKLIELKKNMEQLYTDLEQKRKSVQTSQIFFFDQYKYVEDMLNAMQRYNLTLQTYSPEQNYSKAWYTKRMFRIDFSGSYDNILLFMQNIMTSKLPVSCSYIHFEKQGENILVSCRMAWYSFKKDSTNKNA